MSIYDQLIHEIKETKSKKIVDKWTKRTKNYNS